MHQAAKRLSKDLLMEVLWSDDWLPLSREAEIQISGMAQLFMEA